MRTAGVFALGVVLAASLASSALARPANALTLRVHQTLRVSGTNILCGAGHTAGVTYVYCAIVDSAGDARKDSYLALLTQTGKVNIVTRNTKIVFNRTGTSLLRVALVARPGDTIDVAGVTTIGCSVAKVSGKATVFCDKIDAKGNFVPGSYAFGMSDTIVTALGWNAKRQAHLIHSYPESG
jgi:hypothetical protein